MIDSSESGDRQVESPSSIVIAKETVSQVQLALARLDAERRNIIVLRDLQGIDYAEIASMLDIPVGTVRSRLHRARIELRGIMNAMGIGQSADNHSQSSEAALKNHVVTTARNQL